MAFSGLTALGPQDPLAVSTDAVQHLHIFTDADWQEAFNRQLRKTTRKSTKKVTCDTTDTKAIAALPSDCLSGVLEDVYHGPVPPADLHLLQRWLPPSSDDTITLSAFLTAVQGAHTEAEAQMAGRRFAVGPSCENRSWQEYSDKLRKCQGGVRTRSQKQILPLTAQQEIGWETPNFTPAQARNPKRSSEETKYASEMIKAGQFLY